MNKFYNVILSLGSNSENAKYYLNLAYKELSKYFQIIENTGIIKTEPFGYKEQNYFFNVLIYAKSKYLPGKIMKIIKKIEKHYNKSNKKEIFWGKRNIDIDIIKFDDLNIFSNNLIIPHPGLKDRKYLQEMILKLKNINFLEKK